MSNALVYLMGRAGCFLLAYLDDYVSCHKNPVVADSSYKAFTSLAAKLGLQLAAHKCVGPTTRIEWLGYSIDTKLMTASIPHEKLAEVLAECKAWKNKTRASKKMVQSIAGHLMYVANCVRSARKFTARVLTTLRNMKDKGWTTINNDFAADLAWFYNYAAVANVVFYYAPSKPEVSMECDSSLYAGGGVGLGQYYSWAYSSEHMAKYPDIVHLEAINLLVTYHTLAHLVPNTGVLVVIFTDNIGSKFALESGKTKDNTLAMCAREIWLEASIHNHHVEIRHKPGTELILADALSRQKKDPRKAAIAHQMIMRDKLSSVSPKLRDYVFFDLFL